MTLTTGTIPVNDADPFGPDILEDPSSFHRELRDAGPVVYLSKYDVYAMGRYAEVHQALVNWQDFQSGAGVGLSNFRYEEPWRPPSLLLETDPPKHDAPRVVLSSILGPSTLRALRDQWFTDAEELIDTVLGDATGPVEIDAMKALAEAFPLRVFPDAVGIPREGRENLLPYGDHLFNAFGPPNELVERGNPHIAELSAWVNAQCAREVMTTDGFGAAIWAASDRGDITPEQAPLVVRSLLSAGVDTTVQGLGAVLYALATNPDQWARIKENPSLIRIAFDEAVRVESPVQTFFRTATRDVVVGDAVIPDGKKILMFLGSANSDPRRWDDADKFDLSRDPSGHVGFGMGIHQCVGQHIARLEVEALLTALVARVDSIEIAGTTRRHHNNTMHAWGELPMRLHPTPDLTTADIPQPQGPRWKHRKEGSMSIDYDKMFIGGEWVHPSSHRTYTVTSASAGERIGSVPEGAEADIDAAVAAARRAFDDPNGWSSWEPARRAAAMESLANELEARDEEMARRVSMQIGMPISIAGQLEADFPLVILRYFADLLKTAEFEVERPHVMGGTSIVRKEAIGVVGAIAPWNYPQTLASFKHAPAMAAGCTVVLKPSPEAVLDAMLFAEAVEASDVPAGVINIVPAGREVGAYLVQHPDVNKVAFTGSTGAGRQIAETCGRLLRPVTLELGGKSAALILDDADLDLAKIGQDLFASTLINNGQTCYLGTRVLAPRSRYDEVVDTFAAFVNSLKVGDALDPETQIGPMATSLHRDRVEGYIAKGSGDGARLVAGGGRPESVGDGWFVQPTVFADVDNKSTIAQEEIFGPVLSIIGYDNEDDAIRIANDSDYGLGGTVWTADPERGKAIARRVQTGTIGINRYMPDPGSPFGGVKASGIGRELGPDALNAYQQFKTIYA